MKDGGDGPSTPRIILFRQVEDREFNLCVICLSGIVEVFLSLSALK